MGPTLDMGITNSHSSDLLPPVEKWSAVYGSIRFMFDLVSCKSPSHNQCCCDLIVLVCGVSARREFYSACMSFLFFVARVLFLSVLWDSTGVCSSLLRVCDDIVHLYCNSNELLKLILIVELD